IPQSESRLAYQERSQSRASAMLCNVHRLVACISKIGAKCELYHSISNSATPKLAQFAISPEMFTRQMEYLYNHACTRMTVTQFVNTVTQGVSVLPECPVVITFDDGFAVFLQVLFLLSSSIIFRPVKLLFLGGWELSLKTGKKL